MSLFSFCLVFIFPKLPDNCQAILKPVLVKMEERQCHRNETYDFTDLNIGEGFLRFWYILGGSRLQTAGLDHLKKCWFWGEILLLILRNFASMIEMFVLNEWERSGNLNTCTCCCFTFWFYFLVCISFLQKDPQDHTRDVHASMMTMHLKTQTSTASLWMGLAATASVPFKAAFLINQPPAKNSCYMRSRARLKENFEMFALLFILKWFL